MKLNKNLKNKSTLTSVLLDNVVDEFAPFVHFLDCTLSQLKEKPITKLNHISNLVHKLHSILYSKPPATFLYKTALPFLFQSSDYNLV